MHILNAGTRANLGRQQPSAYIGAYSSTLRPVHGRSPVHIARGHVSSAARAHTPSHTGFARLLCLRGGGLRGAATLASTGSNGVDGVGKKMFVWRVDGLSDTEKLARSMADAAQKGDVILLKGEVGAGKTTFARTFIRAYTKDEELTVASPSFLLHLQYPGGACTVHHLDLYRLGQRADISFLGLDHLLPSGVSLIEWPCDSLYASLPPSYLTLSLRELRAEEAEATGAGDELDARDSVVTELQVEEKEGEDEEGEFALPPMDGPRVVEVEAVGDRWLPCLESLPP